MGDMSENVHRVLECKTKNEVAMYLDFETKSGSMALRTYMREVLGSYTVFVSSSRCGEDFIMPDAGWSRWEGPLKNRKLNALLETFHATGDQVLANILHLLTPSDYSIFPISSDLAVLCVSPFYKLCMPNSPYNIIFPEEAPTVGAAMGFGKVTTFQPPEVKGPDDEGRWYVCEIKQLRWSDVAFLNALLARSASEYIAFASKDRIQRTIETCNGRNDMPEMPDLSFLSEVQPASNQPPST